jgi:hypothetical protein
VTALFVHNVELWDMNLNDSKQVELIYAFTSVGIGIYGTASVSELLQRRNKCPILNTNKKCRNCTMNL